jgi:uncharacterized membrane protein YqjE
MTMPKNPKQKSGGPPEIRFLTAVIDFAATVLKSIADDNLLRLLWAVEVLLFFALALMTMFGGLTGDQRFQFALVTIVLIVATFLVIAWRTGGTIRDNPLQPLDEHAATCRDLLETIAKANTSVQRRNRNGQGPWAQMATDTYNHVCQERYLRRNNDKPPDAYFDAIRNDEALGTVCDEKWRLGQQITTYRTAIDAVPPYARTDRTLGPRYRSHDAFEHLIRRAITEPDITPSDLAKAVTEGLALAGNM